MNRPVLIFFSKTFGKLCLAVCLVFSLPSNLYSDPLVWSSTDRIELLSTGNTLGLSGATNENGPGVSDSIHTFLSLDPESTDDFPGNPSNPWLPPTTNDYSQNGSTAELPIQEGSEVVRAELIWGGSFRYVEDVSSALDGSVIFITPNGSSEVFPSQVSARTLDSFSGTGQLVAYYLRSSDVTDLVKQAGGGTYAVSGVPGTQHETINNLNAAGWTLIVAVKKPEFACADSTLSIVGEWVDEFTVAESLIQTRNTNTATRVGHLLVGAIEGDATSQGDGLYVKPSDSTEFLQLNTANNPAFNFFGSQINNASGSLDSGGLYGSVNHNPITGTNVVGGRQGWDITGVQLTSADGHLSPSTENLVIKAATTGDAFVLSHLATTIQVDTTLCPTVDEIFYDGFERQAAPAQ